jgi:hypothetical protein
MDLFAPFPLWNRKHRIHDESRNEGAVFAAAEPDKPGARVGQIKLREMIFNRVK